MTGDILSILLGVALGTLASLPTVLVVTLFVPRSRHDDVIEGEWKEVKTDSKQLVVFDGSSRLRQYAD